MALLALCGLSPQVAAQGDGTLVTRVERLYARGEWSKVIEIVPAEPEASPDLSYYRGLALAKLGRWSQAHAAFASGQQKGPRDKRFPIELAGVDFRQKRFAEAETHLRRALRLDPGDSYALNFLATLYLLDQNLDASVSLWNRIDKPWIVDVRVEPQPRLRPALLDRAFAFSPASVLRTNDLYASRARLDRLGIFPEYRLDLEPHTADEEKFDLVFRASELNGWGDTKLEGLLRLLGGLPYATVYPEWWNIRRSALNFTSLARWDENKRRVWLALGSPLRQNPKWYYELYADARDENWDLTDTFHATPHFRFNLRRVEGGARVRSAVNGRWSWWTGASIARRGFRHLAEEAPPFAGGTSLVYEAGIARELVRLPERRLTFGSTFEGEMGRLFAPHAGLFSKAQERLQLRWFPKPRGDDYEVLGQFAAGKCTGSVPFDELFILGLERDNELGLRAHIGTRAGKKGSAPLGPAYVLGNWEISKKVYDGRFLKLRLAPFLDNGEAYDASGKFGSRQWLWDTGAQAKLRVWGGVTVVFSYGKDLRSGRNGYYTTLER